MLKIIDKVKCCGCSACVSICPKNCISFIDDNEGFSYPVVDMQQCIDCHKCEKVCPILNKKNSEITYNECQTKEAFTHAVCLNVEGDMPNVYAAYNLNGSIRENSTSGGVFSALANYIFDRNGWVFGVIVDDRKGIQHYGTPNREELYKFRGSKYVQSDMTGVYAQIRGLLKKDNWVLYSGTPCQVEGLKKYLGTVYDKLVTVDIFCHGVGSPMYWGKYVHHMEEKYKSPIKMVKFREKTYGYNSACMALYFENGDSSHKGHDDDLYWTAFSKCFIFRPSCYACQFKTIRHVSDFTIGDFWSSKELPEDFERANGCTLIIEQSDRAGCILKELEKSLKCHAVEMEKALLINGGPMPSKLISSSPIPKKFADFRKDMNRLGLEELTHKYMPLTFKQRIKCMVKPIMYKLGILRWLKGVKHG